MQVIIGEQEMLNKNDYILTVFKELFADQYDIIGHGRTQNLVSNATAGSSVNFVSSSMGASLEIDYWIQQSFVIIQVIAAVVQIVSYFKENSKSATHKEITEELKQKDSIIFEKISVKDFEKIVVRIQNEQKDSSK